MHEMRPVNYMKEKKKSENKNIILGKFAIKVNSPTILGVFRDFDHFSSSGKYSS